MVRTGPWFFLLPHLFLWFCSLNERPFLPLMERCCEPSTTDVYARADDYLMNKVSQRRWPCVGSF